MDRIILKASAKTNKQVRSYLGAIKRGMTSQHVAPQGKDWVVKKTDAKRATRCFSTQKEAISYAENIAKKQKSDLFIHGSDGRIRSRKSY